MTPSLFLTTNPDTKLDYQWAMDVVVVEEDGTTAVAPPSSSFADSGGACEGKVRVVGRSTDTVTVTIALDTDHAAVSAGCIR